MPVPLILVLMCVVAYVHQQGTYGTVSTVGTYIVQYLLQGSITSQNLCYKTFSRLIYGLK
jgi:hypothetical protein